MDFANTSHLMQAVFVGVCALALCLGISAGQQR